MKRGNGHSSKNKTADRKRLELPKSRFRTAVANGARVLDGIDGRSTVARRYREISGAIANDLGGPDILSEAQVQLIRSAAGLVVLRERLDARLVNGEKVKTVEYTRISNTLRRVLESIGLKREPRDITPPDPLDYARTVEGQQ